MNEEARTRHCPCGHENLATATRCEFCDRDLVPKRRRHSPVPPPTKHSSFARAILGEDLLQSRQRDVRDPLLWFYATLGMRRTGDPGFASWSAFTVRTLLESQRRDGSWVPEMLHGQQGGPAYATAMGALVLAVDFRDRRTYP